jgi:hypothetical protein
MKVHLKGKQNNFNTKKLKEKTQRKNSKKKLKEKTQRKKL